MLVFERLTNDNIETLARRSVKCPYRNACYSAGQLLMWQDYYSPFFAFLDDCVLVKLFVEGKTQFLYPYSVENGPVDKVLLLLEKYCNENYIPLSFYCVPEQKLAEITLRYADYSVVRRRCLSDYVYSADDLIELSGKKYSGQRNHINKFQKLYPTAKLLPLNQVPIKAVEDFFVAYSAQFSERKKNFSARQELEYSISDLRKNHTEFERAACVTVDDKVVSVCYGEIMGDMLIVHMEKALYDYEGAYPFTVNAFARAYAGGASAVYVSREDDNGDAGLRHSKLQYHPVRIEPLYSVDVNTPLSRLQSVPRLTDGKITLDEITVDDSADYSRLCLDEKHNKYWGYVPDMGAASKNPDYFYLDALNDWSNRVGLSFAVRYGGVFVGEAVICHFDYVGGANLGLRLLPEYAGKGISKPAFALLADWALYGLDLDRATAYCYRQNIPSCRMLAYSMDRVGEDDTFVYFVKRS